MLFTALFWVALVMAALSWLIFLDQTYRISGRPKIQTPAGAAADIRREGIDPAKVAEEIAKLAATFGKVGIGPTSAALSVLYLIIALIAAGLGKL
jgi:hypothetical protein